MENLSEAVEGRGDSAPEERIPAGISDADRAANPFGVARAERDRDNQGRFAPRAKEGTQPQDGAAQEPVEGNQPPVDPAQQRDTDNVPRQAMLAERRKYQELEASIPNRIAEAVAAEFQKRQSSFQQPQQPVAPQQPPPYWENPEAATDYRVNGAISPVAKSVEDMKVEFSRQFATIQHGEPAVNSAIEALHALSQSNPTEYTQLEAQAAKSMHPVDVVMRWHKKHQALAEIGNDPAAWKAQERERMRQELLAESQGAFETQPAPAAQPPRLPNSFATPRPGGPRGASGFGGPRPLSQILPRG